MRSAPAAWSPTSGNHAQAVARAARLLGAHAVICMPRDAPRVKIEGVERDGAEIQFTGMDSEERHVLALRLVEERGLVMVEPYDDPAIIAGQGTCGLEIVEDLPNVTSVLIPNRVVGCRRALRRRFVRWLPARRSSASSLSWPPTPRSRSSGTSS